MHNKLQLDVKLSHGKSSNYLQIDIINAVKFRRAYHREAVLW